MKTLHRHINRVFSDQAALHTLHDIGLQPTREWSAQVNRKDPYTGTPKVEPPVMVYFDIGDMNIAYWVNPLHLLVILTDPRPVHPSIYAHAEVHNLIPA
jgi:hypothetical protein